MSRRDRYEKLLKRKLPVWGPELNSEFPTGWLVRRAPDWLVFGAIGVALGLLVALLIVTL